MSPISHYSLVSLLKNEFHKVQLLLLLLSRQKSIAECSIQRLLEKIKQLEEKKQEGKQQPQDDGSTWYSVMLYDIPSQKVKRLPQLGDTLGKKLTVELKKQIVCRNKKLVIVKS